MNLKGSYMLPTTKDILGLTYTYILYKINNLQRPTV